MTTRRFTADEMNNRALALELTYPSESDAGPNASPEFYETAIMLRQAAATERQTCDSCAYSAAPGTQKDRWVKYWTKDGAIECASRYCAFFGRDVPYGANGLPFGCRAHQPKDAK